MESTLISARSNEETPSLNRARRAALGSFAGAVVDWYDFLLYGITAALVFNREFFPQVSPAMGTLAAFATFGVGFLFRPLGGVIFGHFGDRLGRKRMLMLTVWMMGIATALIGILPSFSAIGWWAPVLLVTLRAIQGFAVGGEYRHYTAMQKSDTLAESGDLGGAGADAGASGPLFRGRAAFAGRRTKGWQRPLRWQPRLATDHGMSPWRGHRPRDLSCLGRFAWPVAAARP